MPSDEVISSLTNPRVKRVVRLRKARERRAAGVLLAEGTREVSRAFAAGLEVVALFAWEGGDDAATSRGKSGGIRGYVASLRSPRLKEVGVTWVSEAVLTKMAYHDKPEGVLAVFKTPGWTLKGLSDSLAGGGFFLVAVGTEKPGNLGAMVRTAAAAGCDAVLTVGPAVDVFNPNAIRNSTGAVFALPTVVVDDAPQAIRWLQDRGVTIAAALADGGRNCFAGRWAPPGGSLAVVVGPEHAGLDEAWRDAADVKLTIPHADSGAGSGGDSGGGVTDSLNASNAAAVLLFEAVRRRGGG